MNRGTSLQLLEPDLRRVRADNQSALTGTGTNTYLLGRGEVIVIDPGPDFPSHLEAIRAARLNQYFSESLFARFVVLGMRGTWKGRTYAPEPALAHGLA